MLINLIDSKMHDVEKHPSVSQSVRFGGQILAWP